MIESTHQSKTSDWNDKEIDDDIAIVPKYWKVSEVALSSTCDYINETNKGPRKRLQKETLNADEPIKQLSIFEKDPVGPVRPKTASPTYVGSWSGNGFSSSRCGAYDNSHTSRRVMGILDMAREYNRRDELSYTIPKRASSYSKYSETTLKKKYNVADEGEQCKKKEIGVDTNIMKNTTDPVSDFQFQYKSTGGSKIHCTDFSRMLSRGDLCHPTKHVAQPANDSFPLYNEGYAARAGLMSNSGVNSLIYGTSCGLHSVHNHTVNFDRYITRDQGRFANCDGPPPSLLKMEKLIRGEVVDLRKLTQVREKKRNERNIKETAFVPPGLQEYLNELFREARMEEMATAAGGETKLRIFKAIRENHRYQPYTIPFYYYNDSPDIIAAAPHGARLRRSLVTNKQKNDWNCAYRVSGIPCFEKSERDKSVLTPAKTVPYVDSDASQFYRGNQIIDTDTVKSKDVQSLREKISKHYACPILTESKRIRNAIDYNHVPDRSTMFFERTATMPEEAFKPRALKRRNNEASFWRNPNNAMCLIPYHKQCAYSGVASSSDRICYSAVEKPVSSVVDMKREPARFL